MRDDLQFRRFLRDAAYLTGAAVLIALIALAAACGPDARQVAADRSFAAVQATARGYIAWDLARQMAIVDDCIEDEQCSEAEGEARLERYRLRRAAFLAALKTAGAVALAARDPSQASLEQLAAAMAELQAALAEVQKESDP